MHISQDNGTISISLLYQLIHSVQCHFETIFKLLVSVAKITGPAPRSLQRCRLMEGNSEMEHGYQNWTTEKYQVNKIGSHINRSIIYISRNSVWVKEEEFHPFLQDTDSQISRREKTASHLLCQTWSLTKYCRIDRYKELQLAEHIT